jgi:hypothetical protein
MKAARFFDQAREALVSSREMRVRFFVVEGKRKSFGHFSVLGEATEYRTRPVFTIAGIPVREKA